MINLSDIAQNLSQSAEIWEKEQIGNFNGSQVNVRYMNKALTPWHEPVDTDEMFIVLSGSVIVETEDRSVLPMPNDCLIIKAGIRHRSKTDSVATLFTLVSG